MNKGLKTFLKILYVVVSYTIVIGIAIAYWSDPSNY